VSSSDIALRTCHGTDEFTACVALQKEVWNFSDTDLIPLRMFVVASKIGGQVIGAFAGETLIGFALSIPGSRRGHSYLHSHMLAVRESYRNLGLGRRLKLAQREDAIARGFDLMEWTFDPLEIKNAHLNIARLGAIARRYTINQYGCSSSPLQGGLPTDRLVAEWWLNSSRVRSMLEGNSVPPFIPELEVQVPSAVYQWKSSADLKDNARSLQLENRELFRNAFSRGLAVLDYRRDSQNNGTFILGRWDETWSYATEERGPHED